MLEITRQIEHGSYGQKENILTTQPCGHYVIYNLTLHRYYTDPKEKRLLIYIKIVPKLVFLELVEHLNLKEILKSREGLKIAD